jgi:hypothetical protein
VSAVIASESIARTRTPRARRAPPGRGAMIAFAFAFALVLGAGSAAAGQIDFSASVDQTTIGLGQQFQLVLTVQGEDMLSVPTPQLPALPDLNVLGNTSSQSTSISIVNGQMKRQATVSFIYVLSAKALGKTVIPPCRLVYQGAEYRSQPIEITVIKAAQGQATPMPPTGAPTARAQVPIEGNLSLTVAPSRKTVYLGEPVTVEVALATRFQISNGGWAAAPTFDGFWTEKIFDADKFDFQRRTIAGKTYGVSLLKKAALFPLSPGPTTIKPMAFNLEVVQTSRDIFDMFGGSQTVRVESKPVTIEVLPLPDKGKPASFTGGVGQFALSAALDRTATTNSEPLNLTLKVSGTGNIRMIDKPVVEPIAGVRILAPETKDDIHVSGEVVRGTKTFRYPLIPQGDGKYRIAPIEIAYFDPRAKAYHTLRSEPLEFTASASVTSAPLADVTGLRVLGTDISYIKPDAVALATMPMNPPAWPSALYVLSLGLVGGAFWFRAHSLRLESDRGYARKARSSALVKRRLKQAETLLRKKDEKGFYSALAQAVTGYVGDRLNIDTHALTKDQLRAEMDRLAVAPGVSAAVLEIVDQCEVARFSPGALGSHDAESLFEKTRDALGRI